MKKVFFGEESRQVVLARGIPFVISFQRMGRRLKTVHMLAQSSNLALHTIKALLLLSDKLHLKIVSWRGRGAVHSLQLMIWSLIWAFCFGKSATSLYCRTSIEKTVTFDSFQTRSLVISSAIFCLMTLGGVEIAKELLRCVFTFAAAIARNEWLEKGFLAVLSSYCAADYVLRILLLQVSTRSKLHTRFMCVFVFVVLFVSTFCFNFSAICLCFYALDGLFFSRFPGTDHNCIGEYRIRYTMTKRLMNTNGSMIKT